MGRVDNIFFLLVSLVFINNLITKTNCENLAQTSNNDILLTAAEDLKKEHLFSDDAILKILSQNADSAIQNNETSEHSNKLFGNSRTLIDCFNFNKSFVIINNASICETRRDCFKRQIAKCCFVDRNSNSELNLSDVGHEEKSTTLLNVPLAGDDTEYSNNNNATLLYADPNKRTTSFFSPQHLFEMIPPFELHTTPGVSEKCRRQSAIYVEDLKALQLWALRMYDSSTKIPSGFLNGNINQYGDIDQCLEVRHNTPGEDSIKGQYCLASLQLSLSSNASKTTREIFELVHSHYAFRSKLTDPGHRVPRFSSINWALCIPSGCTAQDVQLSLEHSIRYSSLQGEVSAEVLVEGSMCQMQEDIGYSKGFKYVGSLFMIFILLAVLATIGEVFYKESTPEWLYGFSVVKNMRQILSVKPPSCSDDEVGVVHGIRCLNAIMLLIAHKSMAIFFLPFVNRTHMAKLLGQPWSVIGRTASLYTDPFIMFSGLLTCYSLLGRHRRGQTVSVINEYLCRLFRLLPTMGALMLFCTWVLPELSSGPQWPLVITQHAHICKKNWWRNLLFIHNYFGFENMCLTHTHHVGIDTQLFILGVPLSLWLVTNTSALKRNVCILILIATVSTMGRFYISYTMKLANFVSFGSSVEQLFRTADYMYIIPGYRITVYIMGMLLALLLRNPPKERLTQFFEWYHMYGRKHNRPLKDDVTEKSLRGIRHPNTTDDYGVILGGTPKEYLIIKKTLQLRLGWFVAVSMFLTSFFLPSPMSLTGYQYNAISAALYASLAPVGWSSSFAWIIYTQHHGYNTWLGDIFSWRVFAVWTRLSYAIYLTQFPVFFYLVGTTRSPQYYSVLDTTINFKELFLILLTSILLTLLFDLPFQNIRKIVCRPRNTTATIRVKKIAGEINKTLSKSSFGRISEFIGQSVAIVERNTDKKFWKAD